MHICPHCGIINFHVTSVICDHCKKDMRKQINSLSMIYILNGDASSIKESDVTKYFGI